MNDWARRFGKARAASDKKLLQEVERLLANPTPEAIKRMDAFVERDIQEITERERIARAFGRPKDVWQ
jgi:hypothetical protein